MSVYTKAYARDMKFAGFEWDHGNWPKCAEHGLSRSEIEHALLTEPAVLADLAHSAAEQRWRAIGRAPNGRHVFIVFTWRFRAGVQYLRSVSARYMRDKEVRAYERGS